MPMLPVSTEVKEMKSTRTTPTFAQILGIYHIPQTSCNRELAACGQLNNWC